jgi:hypothetical protein
MNHWPAWSPQQTQCRQARRGQAHAAAATLFVVLALAQADASAQDTERWQFTGSLNVYLPSLGGSSIFPASGGGSAATIDTGSVLDHLEGTFMGSLEARKGPWGLFTDLLYLDLSADKSGSRAINIGGVLPAGASADVSLGLSGTLWTLGGTYRVLQAPRQSMDVLAGARLLSVRTSASWQFVGNVGQIATVDRFGERSGKVNNWDAIVGVKGRYGVGGSGKWFLPYYLDVGTGESRLTYQAVAGVGYAFSWGDIAGSWRYIKYDFKDGKALKDLSASGPMVSAIFHW